MKKPTSRKLAVARETVRNLSAIQLGAAAGGLVKGPPVDTTHSMITVCTLPSTSTHLTTGTIFDTGVSG